MKCFHVIAHTHWDREWYRTFQENRVRLVDMIDDLLDLLRRDRGFTSFMMDGQTSLLHDYLEIRPDRAGLLQDLIAERRLVVGPWYVQPDENLPGLEGLIRNLLIGRGIATAFGHCLEVGYLPDSFGQSAAMPTILQGFGIDTAVFYRGLSVEDTSVNEFNWQALDGSSVLAVWLKGSYGNAMFLSPDPVASLALVEGLYSELADRTTGDQYLLMCGSDHCYAKPFLPELLDSLNRSGQERAEAWTFRLDSLEDYFAAIKAQRVDLPTVCGELRKGHHSRCHNSIGATRIDIKLENRRLEQLYTDVLEPLSALAWLAGGKYHKPLIDRGWRYILENQAHDSLCCCCTDQVHQDLEQRHAWAGQIATTLLEQQQELLYRSMAFRRAAGRPLLVSSLLLGRRCEIVSATVYAETADFSLLDHDMQPVPFVLTGHAMIDANAGKVSFTPLPPEPLCEARIEFPCEMDGFGYRSYYIHEGTARPAPAITTDLLADDSVMLENSSVSLSIATDGSLNIVDKLRGNCFGTQHVFEDGGNAGDEYDYSPPKCDRVISSTSRMSSASTLKYSVFRKSLRLAYRLPVPLETGPQRRGRRTVALDIETIIELDAGSPLIRFKTTVNNTARDHRLQVAFDLGERVDRHSAGIQTGMIERENRHAETARSSREFCERHYPVYTHHGFVCFRRADGSGFAILSRGLPQYEIDDGSNTRCLLTLLSSVGYMGRADLLYRPGRRSGSAIATPQSQLPGPHQLEYAFLPIGPDTDICGAADAYCRPPRCLCSPEYGGSGLLPDQLTLARSDAPLRLSAFKCAESADGYILRLVNPQPASVNAAVLELDTRLFGAASLVDLAERPVDQGAMHCGWINNADGSDKSRFSGRVTLSEFPRNAVRSLLLTDRRPGH
jgi:mannosylglycerate hydrolase